MTLTSWLSIVAICTMGAMSPGPSLAVVVRNTVVGGRLQGVSTALAHAVGIALYALLTVTGLAVILAENPRLFELIQWLGAGFLVYMGMRSILRPSTASAGEAGIESGPAGARGLVEGFMVAFLNPKIALFFIALFSQFVNVNAGWTEKMIMTLTAGGIDGLWYVIVAVALSQSRVLEKFRANAVVIDRIFGAILIGVAVRVIV